MKPEKTIPWKVYHDQGGGVTRVSLDYFHRLYRRLGKICRVSIDQHRVFSMEIRGVDGVMLLSGCNCGYGGEGPHGTFEVLKELGVTDEATLAKVFTEPYLEIRVRQG